MIVSRAQRRNGAFGTSFLIPLQALTVAQMAGQWNHVACQGDGSFTASHGSATLDDSGEPSAISRCSGQTCEPVAVPTASGDLSANPAGGFLLVNPASGRGACAFAFKPAQGSMMMIALDPDEGGLVWQPGIGSSEITAQTVTVTAVDADAGSFTRLRESDSRIDTFTINSPRDGMRLRATAEELAGVVLLPVPGTGLAFYSNLDADRKVFGVSVNRP